VTTHTKRISTIRKSADMFGKSFIRLYLWRKCKISIGSLWRNYTQSSSVRVNVLAIFILYDKVLCDEERTWFGLLDWTFLSVIEKAKDSAMLLQLLEANPIRWDSYVECSVLKVDLEAFVGILCGVVQPGARTPFRCPWMCFTDSVPFKKILHCVNISFSAHAIAQPCRHSHQSVSSV